MNVEQRCLALVATTDIEALQERTLKELCELSGAQSAALWVASDRQMLRLRAFRGLVDRSALPVDVEVGLVQPSAWRAGGALLVPLVAQTSEVHGLVQLSEPIGGAFLDEQVQGCQRLGPFAGEALKQASRFLSLQRQGLRDRETGAYTLSYFTDYATREIAKARRYGRSFSLVAVSLDNLGPLRARLGPPAARQAQQLVLKVLGHLARDADVVARASDSEFYALLPESDFFGGHVFLRRVVGALFEAPEARALQARVPLGLTGGVATFPKDGDDFDELLSRCRTRMEERRASLHHTMRLQTLSFWEQVELLLGTPQSPPLPEAAGLPSRRGRVSEVLFEELQREIARELMRTPQSRGLLFVAGGPIKSSLPLLKQLEEEGGELNTRVHVIGRRADVATHPQVMPIFVEGDAKLARHEVLLWLGEGTAYLLLQRRGRGATWAFHSSDAMLVEGLVSKLQLEYEL